MAKRKVGLVVNTPLEARPSDLRAARKSNFMCALLATLRKVNVHAPGGGDAMVGEASRPAYSVLCRMTRRKERGVSCWRNKQRRSM